MKTPKFLQPGPTQSTHTKHEPVQLAVSIFVDRRPEMIIQRSLMDIINNSPQVRQDKTLKERINNGPVMAAQHQRIASFSGKPVQRKKILTMGGEWEDVVHEKIQKQDITGLDMRLEFTPNASVDASKIGLTQAIHPQVKGEPKLIGLPKQKALQHHRMVTEQESKGWMVDRLGNPNNVMETGEPNNPIYGSDQIQDPKGKTLRDTTFNDQKPGFSQLGRHEPGHLPVKAVLADTPKLTSNELGPDSHQKFETTALALEGKQEGVYYGSVTWGWEIDQSGEYKEIELAMGSFGNPSHNFLKSAEKWNTSGSNASMPYFGKGDVEIEGQQYNIWKTDNARNIPLPGPSINNILKLPDVAIFKSMKKVATNRITPFSGKLKTKSYGEHVKKCTDLRNEGKLDELRNELEKLQAALSQMDAAKSGFGYYWKSVELKTSYFMPIYNSVKVQLQMVTTKMDSDLK